MVLPALESFAQWWMLPKVNYLFYQYFYKAAVGDATWKSRLAENKRLGPVILEAYAHATLHNQYFAWLYEYKADHPDTTLMTEYDLVQDVRPETRSLFCGTLDLLEVSVPRLPANDSSSSEQESEEGEARDDFKLLLEENAWRRGRRTQGCNGA